MSTHILVLHAKQPTFFEAKHRAVLRDSFVEVAKLALDATGEDALDVAYARTQNLDEAWRAEAPCRSTSVGDVLVLDSNGDQRAYEVAMLGFKRITLT